MNVPVRPYVREGHAVAGYSQKRKRKFLIDRAERVFKIFESGGHEFVLPVRALNDAVVSPASSVSPKTRPKTTKTHGTKF